MSTADPGFSLPSPLVDQPVVLDLLFTEGEAAALREAAGRYGLELAMVTGDTREKAQLRRELGQATAKLHGLVKWS